MAFLAFFFVARHPPHRNFHLTTQGKPAAFIRGQLAKPATDCPNCNKLSKFVPHFAGMKWGDGKRRRPKSNRIT
jgi:hypothetical protein